MAEILTIPLSVHQQKQVEGIDAQMQAAQTALNTIVTTVIAAQVDPATVQGWDIRRVGTNIVCTPPTDA